MYIARAKLDRCWMIRGFVYVRPKVASTFVDDLNLTKSRDVICRARISNK